MIQSPSILVNWSGYSPHSQIPSLVPPTFSLYLVLNSDIAKCLMSDKNTCIVAGVGGRVGGRPFHNVLTAMSKQHIFMTIQD